MNTLVAVFRSATQTRAFAEQMRAFGAWCRVVSTPTEIRVGCGSSAEFYSCDYNKAVRVIRSGGYNSLVGIFEKRRVTGRTVYAKV